MKKKLYILLPFCIAIWITSIFVNIYISIILAVIGVFGLLSIILFYIVNKLVKSTNWWKNQYLATEQFVSNTGYRNNIIRNYDVVNLGSNPAHFAFFYETVKGQSWATGSQGQDMDLEILKYFHSYLRKGGIVLIPIMPFTAISTYLKKRPEYWGLSYYSKFAKILDYAQTIEMPYGVILKRYLNYPLLYNWKAIRYVFKDVQPDILFKISEQPMMKMELEQDAKMWINGWLNEFKLCNLNEVFDERWKEYYLEAIELNKKIVDYCLERDLKPVFICVPMTIHLYSLFPKDFFKYMTIDFVKKANVHNVPFLDYTTNEKFADDKFYFNSFFLNLNGRKQFTKQVLDDLGQNDRNIKNLLNC